MRLTVGRGVLVGAAMAVAVGLGVSGSTAALFVDNLTSTAARAGAATVVLGDEGESSLVLSYEGLEPGEQQTVQLQVDYRGSVPADLSLHVDAPQDSAFCSTSSGEWSPRPLAGLTVTVDGGHPTAYCSLLNGTSLPLAAGVAAGSTTTYDIGLELAGDAVVDGVQESVATVLHAVSGFSDTAVGRLDILTVAAPFGANLRSLGEVPQETTSTDPAAAPEPDLDPTEVEVPAECAAAGMRREDFAEVIALAPGTGTWDAVEQRGPTAGPFLILGTDGDDVVLGSGGADCIAGGAGDDAITGRGGDDVLIGGPGPDVILGGAGDDQLFGGAALDELDGGDGVDLLDGGPDGADCIEADPGSTTVACLTTLDGAAADGAVLGDGSIAPVPTSDGGPTSDPVPTSDPPSDATGSPPSSTPTEPVTADAGAPEETGPEGTGSEETGPPSGGVTADSVTPTSDAPPAGETLNETVLPAPSDAAEP